MTFKTFALTAAAVAALSPPALAQPAQTRPAPAAPAKRAPASVAEMRSSFAPVVRASAPAVVNVFSERRTQSASSRTGSLFSGGLPRERVEQSLGSGAIVRGDGVIVTNNHVIEGNDTIRVVLADRREFPAKVLLADPRSDLAVLKIDIPAGETLPIIKIDPDEKLEVGDLVLAIGNPYGVGQTVTNGIISALSRSGVGITDYSFFIQTDAAVNPGNSGGPLVDMDGDLIGLNTAIFSESGGASGISFAIPAAMVRQVVASAVAGNSHVERPWLGAQTVPITHDAAQNLGLSIAQGVQVKQVYPGGPADKGGIKVGDILLTINGESVNDDSAVNYRIGTRPTGDNATLKVMRSGAERTLTVKLATPPGGDAQVIHISGSNPFTGATVSNLTPALAEEKGLDPFLKGVTITEAPTTTARGGFAFKAGDVILEVNGQTIDSTQTLQDAIKSGTRQWIFAVQRGDQVRRIQQVL
ncbi:MAG: Do family serine endopeptidase [Alphaproteobacteria bacterium]